MLTDYDNLNFQILNVFKVKHRAGYFKVKPRRFAALSLRISGSGSFEINGKKLVSNAGELLYIPADMAYEVEYSVSEIIVIHLSECNYPHPETIRPSGRVAVEAQFAKLLEAWNRKCSVFQAKSYVYALLDTLQKSQSAPTENAVLSRCVRYIEEHFTEADVNVEKVCQKNYVSRSTLQRLFSDHFGMSPHEYLTKARMEHALTLLADGESTVKEVALSCGFSDEKYFSLTFKQKYGCPPSQLKSYFFV